MKKILMKKIFALGISGFFAFASAVARAADPAAAGPGNVVIVPPGSTVIVVPAGQSAVVTPPTAGSNAAPPPPAAPPARIAEESTSPEPYWGPHLAGFRIHFDLGVSESSFSQSGNGQSIRLYTPGAIALQLPIGFRIGPVFLEYNFVWLTPSSVVGYLNSPATPATPSDAAYWSALGGNLGVLLPVPYVSVEVYSGLEDGNYGFVLGGSGTWSGPAIKAGLNILYKYRVFGVGLKAEYRRLIVSGDKAGSPAAGVSSYADSFFLGLTVGMF